MKNEDRKMTSDQLNSWLALRKKCQKFKSKKDYSRKEKHRRSLEDF